MTTERGDKQLPRSSFGNLTPEQRRAISSAGGRAAHAKGRAHQWTKEEASAAGSKGGKAVHAKRRAQKEGEQP